MINPNKLNVMLIRIRNNSIQKGCKIVTSIKKAEVIKIISPNTDLLAAAKTYPHVISIGEMGQIIFHKWFTKFWKVNSE